MFALVLTYCNSIHIFKDKMMAVYDRVILSINHSILSALPQSHFFIFMPSNWFINNFFHLVEFKFKGILLTWNGFELNLSEIAFVDSLRLEDCISTWLFGLIQGLIKFEDL